MNMELFEVFTTTAVALFEAVVLLNTLIVSVFAVFVLYCKLLEARIRF